MRAEYGIFGGDDRNGYLAAELIRRGYSVMTYALSCSRSNKPLLSIINQNRLTEKPVAGSLSELLTGSRCIIGTIPYARYEKEHPETKLSQVLLRKLAKGQLFAAGAIPMEQISALKERGVSILDFLKDKNYQSYNAVLTAEGCFAEIRTVWKGKISGARVLVAGYGCCGKAIAAIFQGAGAVVTACVRRTETAFEAYQHGCLVCYPEQLEELAAEQNIIINTVPSLIFNEGELSRVSAETLLVEIASQPGGYEPEVISKRGLAYVNCPGLPGRYAPEAAAAGMADSLERFMENNSNALEQKEGGEKWRLPERE